MTLYKNKYRIETTRLQQWEYSSDGRYFITLCTKNRATFLGKIDKEKMILNEYGLIVEHCWFDLVNHYYNLRKPDIMLYKYKKETSHENQNPFNHPASNFVYLLMPN